MNPSEEAQEKATILFMVRGIVERYGGTVTVDLETDTLHIDVPEDNELACACEIEERAREMGC